MILEAISGYKILFLKTPLSRPYLTEPRLNGNDYLFYTTELNRLFLKGAIEPVNFSPDQYLSSYFLKDKSSGAKRFILNLKSLNEFVDTPHFKMENLKIALRLLLPNCFMASLDLEDSYLLISIHISYRKYLRFSFQGKIFQFTTLPFGLSSAPYIFTKILKPVAATLRKKSFLSVIYLDDFLLFGDTYQDCLVNIKETLQLLNNLGFILNLQKCDLNPSQEKKFLGFILNSSSMNIILPDNKRLTLIERIKNFSVKNTCQIRKFASLIGSLNSICQAVPYGALYIRNFEKQKFLACKQSDGNYDATMTLCPSLQSDFKWWLNKLHSPPVFRSLCRQKFSYEIFSDVSLTGWSISMGTTKTHGWWSHQEKLEHINFLELKAVEYALRTFVSDLRSRDILIRIDNTTAIAYINKMGSSQFPKLSALSKSIWQWCESRDLHIFASYIRSVDNTIADSESRILSNETEWEITPFFKQILETFGPFDIDLFATHNNAKCKSFVSWFPDPFAFAIDAFTLDWENFYFYAFPPFVLIPKVLRKIINDNVTSILMVPRWPAQPWFPLFNKLCFSKLLYINPDPNLLISPFRSQHPNWRNISLLVGKLSAKRSFVKDFPKTL